jgi:hypothetical protein
MLYRPPMRYLWSLVFAFGFMWALALSPRGAFAQTTGTTPSVTGILGAVQRCEPTQGPCNSADNSGNHRHPNGVLVNALNFEDCSADLYYQFELGIAYPNSSYLLEAWAGTQDCSQLSNRQTSATSVCWPVAAAVNANINPTLLNVRMQDIASGAFTTTHQTTYTETNTTNNPNVCQAQTETGATSVTLYIFFVDGGSNPVGTVQNYQISLDMRTGTVPGAITAGVGDTVLIIGIPPTTDPDVQGWNVYCDPPPGQENVGGTVPVDAASNNLCPPAVPDSSTTDAVASDAVSSVSDGASDSATDSATPGTTAIDDAGGNACGVPFNDAGIPSPGGCSASSALIPGGGASSSTTTEEGGTVVTSADGGATFSASGTMDPTFQYGQPNGAKFLCGSSSVTSTSINVKGLKDYSFYNISVAAVDAVGNVGPLSPLVCGEPLPVDDFWKAYTNDNGLAGGGFCSAEGVGVPAGTSGLGVLMVASMVAIVRRRRRS